MCKPIVGKPAFQFKRFRIEQQGAAHPVGTDGVLLGAWTNIDGVRSVLDIGTGTGLVALLLAQRTERLKVERIIGVEPHSGSAASAAKNFKNAPWADRLQVVEQTIQRYQPAGRGFDLIVCNPPYFTAGLPSAQADRRMVRQTDALPQEDLLAAVLDLLAPAGRFCLIMPPVEGRQFCALAAQRRLYFTRLTEVYSRPGRPIERLLLQLERNPMRLRRDKLVLWKTEQEASEEFVALTRDFYLMG